MQTYKFDVDFVNKNSVIASHYYQNSGKFVCIQSDGNLLFSKKLYESSLTCMYSNKILSFEELSKVENPISVVHCSVFGFIILFEDGKLAVIFEALDSKIASKIQRLKFKGKYLYSSNSSFILVNEGRVLHVDLDMFKSKIVLTHKYDVDAIYYNSDQYILIVHGKLDVSLTKLHTKYPELNNYSISDIKLFNILNTKLIIIKNSDIQIFEDEYKYFDDKGYKIIKNYIKIFEKFQNDIQYICGTCGTHSKYFCLLSNGQYLTFENIINEPTIFENITYNIIDINPTLLSSYFFSKWYSLHIYKLTFLNDMDAVDAMKVVCVCNKYIYVKTQLNELKIYDESGKDIHISEIMVNCTSERLFLMESTVGNYI